MSAWRCSGWPRQWRTRRRGFLLLQQRVRADAHAHPTRRNVARCCCRVPVAQPQGMDAGMGAERESVLAMRGGSRLSSRASALKPGTPTSCARKHRRRAAGRKQTVFKTHLNRCRTRLLPTSELSRIHTFVEFDTPRYSAIFRDISRSSAISRDLAISQDITILCYLALFCDLAIPSARLRLNTMAR